MADINCHSEMTNFHRDNVTLSNKQQGEMRKCRDAGRTRLTNGFNEAKKPQPKEVWSQGSYQMRTMVQDEANDYDIDDGAYFASDDLKDDAGVSLAPMAARQMLCDALVWDGRLKEEATVKSNCVRQTYTAGYHIDIPVYRIVTTKSERKDPVDHYELASGDEWTRSDARAVTRWFNNLVGELNSGESDGSQLRRITKLTKKFARRECWKDETTSGICITKLVVDCFSESDARDDKALRQTWTAIDQKLQKSTEIEHPVLSGRLAQEGDGTVTFFKGCLSDALTILEALDTSDSNREKARECWDNVFHTNYFSAEPDSKDDGDHGSGKGSAMSVTSVETARRKDGGGRFG